MGKVLFYHLTRNPLEVTVRMLLEKALHTGWRVTVRGQDEDRLDWLDAQLWLGDKAAFLPHGRMGGPHDADQPVLLTTAPDCPNAPNCLMLIDGAQVEPSEIPPLERVWVLFDGNDSTGLARAREQWKRLVGASVPAEYWSEETGRWQMKTRAGA